MTDFNDPNREAVGLAPIWTGAGDPPPPDPPATRKGKAAPAPAPTPASAPTEDVAVEAD